MPTASGTGLTGDIMSAAIVLPRLSGIGYGGITGAITLPKLRVSGHAFVMEHASAAILIPKLKVQGTGHRSGETAGGNIILPKLVMAQQIRGAAIVLPRLVVHALLTNGGLTTAQAWAMNVKNKAVTQFTNFPFRAFVRWRDHYYGVGMAGGLYLLEGDTDAGTPIPWEWETGLDDLGSNAQKGISGLYIEGAIEAGATVTVVNDKKQRYTYALHTSGAGSDRRTYRVITGKGIRTRNIGIGMANPNGGYMEVNLVSPKLVVSKRNV
jgi:hypothetical protein